MTIKPAGELLHSAKLTVICAVGLMKDDVVKEIDHNILLTAYFGVRLTEARSSIKNRWRCIVSLV